MGEETRGSSSVFTGTCLKDKALLRESLAQGDTAKWEHRPPLSPSDLIATETDAYGNSTVTTGSPDSVSMGCAGSCGNGGSEEPGSKARGRSCTPFCRREKGRAAKYTRDSIGAHTPASVPGVRQMKLYVDAVLAELLEIHRGAHVRDPISEGSLRAATLQSPPAATDVG
jgi:hypothetical protein